MQLHEAIAKAHEELESSRLDAVPAKTVEIFDALEAASTEPVVDALARSLYFSLAEVATRRPETVNVLARQYLAIGIWIGRRVQELTQTRPVNGAPSQ